MLPHNLLKNFERLSGWMTPESFEHENDGYVTLEENAAHHGYEAFLWKPDMSHEHLQTMWMAGHWFVRRS